ncbi:MULTISPECIES: Hsp20/alpha crystallin family protein [unclassified Variovorax]|uniref:Hsp20/alpha crystallin family protein n=1 Tax=unclassified Variovorax TaxID=663243 RepID=UPI001BD51099|nr:MULTISPECIES: Hsp20/alpha crystallin family protein [unclassified Variovorax]
MFFAPALYNCSPRAHDRSFERFVNRAFANATVSRHGVNIEQDDTSWTLSFDVPGLTRDDLSVSIEGAVVRVESKAEARRQVKAAYEMPLEIDTAASEAKLENGVLTLKLGKLQPVSNKVDLSIQ